MKKQIVKEFIALSVLLVGIFCFPTKSEAGEKFKRNTYPFDFEVRIGWSGYPMLDGLFTGNGPFFTSEIAELDFGSVSDLYRTYRGATYFTGTIAAEIDFNFKKWFALTVGVGFDGFWSKLYNNSGEKVGIERGVAFSVLPEARFYWFSTKVVRMYSALGFGLGVIGSSDTVDRFSDVYLVPVFQINPVGISVGKKVYGFAELGYGSQFTGGMAGVGFRF